jgi:DNA-binding NarL/FixJ family response regulator
MRVLIADDQAEVRSALKVLLEQEKHICLFYEAEGISEMLLKTECMQPDLILLDWELSSKAMTQVVPILRQLDPGVIIIALSGRPEASDKALKAGVDAFVSKGETAEKLLKAINGTKH